MHPLGTLLINIYDPLYASLRHRLWGIRNVPKNNANNLPNRRNHYSSHISTQNWVLQGHPICIPLRNEVSSNSGVCSSLHKIVLVWHIIENCVCRVPNIWKWKWMRNPILVPIWSTTWNETYPFRLISYHLWPCKNSLIAAVALWPESSLQGILCCGVPYRTPT